MGKYMHGRTYVCNINYHLVWCVKYRRKVLSPEIANTLYAILHTVAETHGFSIPNVQVGERDHVHCFVTAPPTITISDIAQFLKGMSAKVLMQEYPTLKRYLWGGHLWNPSYFVETIGSTSEENVKRYIESQKSK